MSHQQPRRDEHPKTNPAKQAAKSSSAAPTIPDPPPGLSIPIALQQQTLDVFKNALPARFTSDTLPSLIQQVKGHLYAREFGAAFADDGRREAYALRWSPSRALAYLDVLARLKAVVAIFAGPRAVVSQCEAKEGARCGGGSDRWSGEVGGHDHDYDQQGGATALLPTTATRRSPREMVTKDVKITCLGAGGGAELLAFAGLLRLLQTSSHAHDDGVDESTAPPEDQRPISLTLHLIDMADWSAVLSSLHTTIISPSIPTNHPSTSPSPPAPLSPSNFQTPFHHHNLLTLPPVTLAPLLHHTALVTILFTLNELYTTSTAQTTALLLTITHLLDPGTLLLILDSPGSYSTVEIGSSSARRRQRQQQQPTRADNLVPSPHESRSAVAGSGPGDAKAVAPSPSPSPSTVNPTPASASSSSQAPPPASKSSYPMSWLLDHTLLSVATASGSSRGSGSKAQWTKLATEASSWFRLPRGGEDGAAALAYPVPLEDMRFQLHLYRRL